MLYIVKFTKDKSNVVEIVFCCTVEFPFYIRILINFTFFQFLENEIFLQILFRNEEFDLFRKHISISIHAVFVNMRNYSFSFLLLNSIKRPSKTANSCSLWVREFKTKIQNLKNYSRK